MPIQVDCPECGKRYRFSDERAGESVECKGCGADVDIPGRSRGAKKKRKKQKDSGFTGLIIGGGIATAAVVAGLVAFLMMGRGKDVNRPQDPQIAAANPIVSPPGVPQPGSTPQNASPIPSGNLPASTPAPQNTAPLMADSTKPPTNAGQLKPTTSAAGSGFQKTKDTQGFKPVQNWSVKIDPLAVPIETGDLQKLKIKMTDGFLMDNFVTYPQTPSPFVLVGKNMSNTDSRDVWNLATGAKVATVKGPQITGSNLGFSPDGGLVAWFRHVGTGGGIEVYDIKTKKTLGAVPVDSGKFNVAQVCLPNSSRMVALSNVHRGILTWKLPSGDLEWQITMGPNGQPDPRQAFSPGGRFLAVVADFLTKAVDIYDLDSGQKAGSIEFADRGPDLFGMAFSQDGTLLAMAYGESFSQKTERIVIRNVADGSIRSDFELPHPDQRQRELLNSKSSIQWFPDGKRLLLNGMYLVDWEAQDVVFSFSKPTFDFHTSVSRRVFSNTAVINWDGDRKTAFLTALELKSDEIARAKAIAAAGGLLVDARLPTLTPFDRTKAIDRSQTPSGWKAVADPVTSQGTIGDSIPLASSEGRTRELEFSRLDAGVACLRRADEGDGQSSVGILRSNMISRNNSNRARFRTPPAACRSNWLEFYDLARSGESKRVNLDFPAELMDLSPDGLRALVQSQEGEGRLDVFASDGTHIAGCRPFNDEPDKQKREIVNALFLDASTVAACSMDDRLVAYRLPSCEPVYSIDDAAHAQVSPGGKYLVTAVENRVEFRDALTGESRASTTIQGRIQGISFSPKGDRLAALTSGREGTAISVIELSTGTTTAVPIPQATTPLIWCGDNEILVNSPITAGLTSTQKNLTSDRGLMLIDLNRKAVIWSYALSTRDDLTIATNTFDGRFWVAGSDKKGKPGQILAIRLPEPGTQKLMAGKSFDSTALVQPGNTVGLKVTISNPQGMESLATSARVGIDRAMKSNELTVKDGSPVQLVVSVAPGNSTGTIELQSFGGIGNQNPAKLTAQRKAVVVRVAYETGGKTVWESKHEVTNDFFGLTRITPGQEIQSVLDENMWKRSFELLEQSLPPSYIFSSETARGLGTSVLTPIGSLPL